MSKQNVWSSTWRMRLRLLYLVQFTLQNGTVQNDQKLLIFSFIGSLSHADKWHHRSGTRFKRRTTRLLSFTGTSCWGRLLPLWVIGSSKAEATFDPLQGYNSPSGLSQVLWESFTRWMFKVAELCFVKCVFMLRHVVSSRCYKRVKILH